MTRTEHRPGSRLSRFAERAFAPPTLERVVLPALADLQHECANEAGASRLVRLRAYWGLWKALAVCLLTDWGRYSRPVVEGVAWRMMISIPIVMGAVMVPALNAEFARPRVSTQLVLLSLPQVLMFYIAALRAAGSSSVIGPSVRGVWLVNAFFVLAGLWLVCLRPTPLEDDQPKGYVIS